MRPTPRAQPLFLVPFCAQFFNLGVLDDAGALLDEYVGEWGLCGLPVVCLWSACDLSRTCAVRRPPKP